MAQDPYSSRGGRAYRRQRKALRYRAQTQGWVCRNCGTNFDFDNPQAPNGFTADHPIPLAAGGSLLHQQLVPLCRACNARKGDTVTPTLRPAT